MSNQLKSIFLQKTKQLLQLLSPIFCLPTAATLDPEAAVAAHQPAGPVAGHMNSDEWVKMMVACCFGTAIDIAIISIQVVSKQLPLSFFLVSLATLFAFTCFFLSKFIAYKFPVAALVLERGGVFWMVTGFFIAISIPFPFCLRVTTWVVYAISFVVVLVCNYF